jgi:hypothetical protein
MLTQEERYPKTELLQHLVQYEVTAMGIVADLK